MSETFKDFSGYSNHDLLPPDVLGQAREGYDRIWTGEEKAALRPPEMPLPPYCEE